jgi:hypothetical protein
VIKISGALLLVAAALVVLGWSQDGVSPLLYAGIVLSLLALGLLFLPGGGTPTRGVPSDAPAEQLPALVGRADPDPAADLEDLTADPDGTDRPAGVGSELPAPAPAPDADAEVVVVSGWPHYHRPDCPQVGSDPDAEALPRWEARELEFTPCPECRPDGPKAVTEAPAGPVGAPSAEAPDGPAPADGGNAAPVTVSRRVTVPPAPAGTPVSRITEALGTFAPPEPAPPEPAAGDEVVVVPDRARYHRPDCPSLSAEAEPRPLRRAAAERQGYLPCPTCRP